MGIVGASDEVFEAVYERLGADAALTALISTRLYQHVPEGTQTYPYVQLGEAFETKRATFDKDGRGVLIRIHAWSRYRGQKECWDILSVIGDSLDEYALAIDGATVESCEVEAAQVMIDPDGRTYHGIIDLRVLAAES